MPEITYGRLAPTKALVLSHAGLDALDVSGTTVTLGAGVPVARLVGLAQDVEVRAQWPLSVPDYEIRLQATVGGNLCAGAGHDAPRGDLQGPLLALEAQGASCGASAPFDSA